MQSRKFTDGSGVVWRVRATLPTDRAGAALPEAFSRGWLVFESSEGAIRRLAPVPPGWEDASDALLDRLCESAAAPRSRGDGSTGEGRRYQPEVGRDAGA